MIEELKLAQRLCGIRNEVRQSAPLIHCITNPISINDCANIVLAVGARPIMAEHPREVAEITAMASALALNLGNITDVRMESMRIAAQQARACGLPVILDLVGVGCSRLRRDYAKNLIQECRPTVLKGNVSELRSICDLPSHAEGIDAGERDRISQENRSWYEEQLGNYARKHSAVVLATGACDFIADGNQSWLIANGNQRLTQITGTGCMLNVLVAAFLSAGDIVGAVMLGTLLLGVSGEKASDVRGPGSFRAALLDEVCTVSDEQLLRSGNVI